LEGYRVGVGLRFAGFGPPIHHLPIHRCGRGGGYSLRNGGKNCAVRALAVMGAQPPFGGVTLSISSIASAEWA
jgi:hypothetical protein